MDLEAEYIGCEGGRFMEGGSEVVGDSGGTQWPCLRAREGRREAADLKM